ncbi:MAG TPA: CTP synthetase [Halobacteriales archaeon]|jgi:hypothetical protein|nr:CTP synthetase [Halobacteriales archaeon]|tara:strand:- start:155 stop:481 length:327 start_codon:yes stop_codon:yes gene_type:complete
MKIIFFGSGGDLSSSLSNQGFEIEELPTSRDVYAPPADLILDADLLVITDTSDPTGILLCRELNPDIKTIVYSQDELSDFLRPQIDFALDPQLFPPNLVAEEISNLFS